MTNIFSVSRTDEIYKEPEMEICFEKYEKLGPSKLGPN